jgi:hypothetical protein
MTAQEILLQLRYQLGDTERVTFSDYQLLDALNSVLTLINNALSVQGSNLIEKQVTLTLTDGEIDLPSDFQSVVTVQNTSQTGLNVASKNELLTQYNYRIRGNTIYSLNEQLILVYKQSFDAVGEEDDLPLPNYFSELIKKYAVMVLKGTIDRSDAQAYQVIANDVYKLTAGREYGALDMQVPFYV